MKDLEYKPYNEERNKLIKWRYALANKILKIEERIREIEKNEGFKEKTTSKMPLFSGDNKKDDISDL